jgi:hypothetical protein
MTTTATALKRYNSLFDNRQYRAIADLIANDLQAERESTRVSDAMNLITDMALSLNGHPQHELAWLDLATFCGQNAVSIPTIDAISAYLLIYQQMGDTRAEDFELTAKGLLKSYEAMDALKAALSCANGVHGWRGRTAYDLLAASDFLVQGAVQLLMDADSSYIREKLQHGLKRLTGALHEAVRYSPRPDRFDFSETVFPSHADRR